MACHNQPLSQNPIFIVGYPRSGTTLLQALLATQGDIVTFPETHFFISVFAGNSEFRKTIDKESAVNVLNQIEEKSGITFDRGLIEDLCRSDSSNGIYIKDFFEAIVCKLFPENAVFSQRWLEKTPDHCFHMTQIKEFYPNAKFVGIIRNPFFAIYSRTRYFPPKERDVLNVLANQWVHHIKTFEEFSARNPSKTFLVKYEKLTQNPATIIAAVCEFLQVSFDQKKLENYRQKADSIIKPFEYWKKDVKTSKIYTRKEDPSSIFSIREILKIQSIVFEKMEEYGYEPYYPQIQRIYNYLWG